MTLWVTRQNQDFITTDDYQLCDVTLLSARAQLAGEISPGNKHPSAPGFVWNNTVASSYDTNGIETTFSYNGKTIGSTRKFRTELNMTLINVNIKGMTYKHQFRQDVIHNDNQIVLPVPTNGGFGHGIYEDLGPVFPIIDLEAVKLEPRLTVQSEFFGNASSEEKQCIFVEDWADQTTGMRVNGKIPWWGSSTYKDDPLSVPNENEISNPNTNPNGPNGGVKPSWCCLIPARLVVGIKLVFKITPRNVY